MNRQSDLEQLLQLPERRMAGTKRNDEHERRSGIQFHGGTEKMFHVQQHRAPTSKLPEKEEAEGKTGGGKEGQDEEDEEAEEKEP